MSELESDLNRILSDHQHESGLHVIGGRQKLIERLVRFFESEPKSQTSNTKVSKESQN